MRGDCSWRDCFLLLLCMDMGGAHGELAVFLCMHSGSVAYGVVAFLLLGYMHMEHSIAF